MLVTAVSLHPDLLPDHDVCLPLGHNWPKNIKVAKDAPPLAAAWNVTTLHSMRACSLPKLISQVILDSPAESFSFRHEDSSIFHKFTSDVNGMLSTVTIEYDLHHSSHDHRHSKVSSLEQSRRIPYPHGQDRSFNRRYESHSDRRLFEEDLNERTSDRVRSTHQKHHNRQHRIYTCSTKIG